jgi:Domain of unknown function (DUF4118)
MSPKPRIGPVGALSLALLGPPAAAAVMVALRTHVPNTSLALIMVIVVVAFVVPGQRGAALVAGISAGVWFDFFLTKPYQSFSIHRSNDLQTTILLAVVGIVVGEIAARRRQARAQASLARHEIVRLYAVAQMLSAGERQERIIEVVCDTLRDLLFLESCRFDSEPDASHGPLLTRAGELDYGSIEWPLDQEGLPNRDVSLPVEARGLTVGRFVLRGPKLGVPLSQERRLGAVALADLAGAAMTSPFPSLN